MTAIFFGKVIVIVTVDQICDKIQLHFKVALILRGHYINYVPICVEENLKLKLNLHKPSNLQNKFSVLVIVIVIVIVITFKNRN